MTKWDPTKHPHGVHGHWATVGGTKTGRKKVDRSVQEGRGIVGRSGSAFQPAASAGEARRRKEIAPAKARSVRAVYDKHAAGTATYRERESISFQAPSLRDAQTAKTGSPVRPREQAISAVRTQTRGSRSGFRDRRTSVKTTFGGKTAVVRGEDRPGSRVAHIPTAKQRNARDLMAAKPTPSVSHPQYKRSQLSLKSDAWMREQLTARGVAIPKGARTKVLVNLLASD